MRPFVTIDSRDRVRRLDLSSIRAVFVELTNNKNINVCVVNTKGSRLSWGFPGSKLKGISFSDEEDLLDAIDSVERRECRAFPERFVEIAEFFLGLKRAVITNRSANFKINGWE